MGVLIAFVIMISLVAVLVLFMGKKPRVNSNGSKNKTKTKTQIIKEANKRLAKNPHDPIGLSALGDVYFSSQLWDKAYETYQHLIKIGSKDTSVDLVTSLVRCGIASINLKKPEDALQYLASAYKLDPNNFDSIFYYAKSLYELQQYDKVAPLLKKALISNPEAEGVNSLLGLALYNAKKFRESLSPLKKALDEEPSNKEILFAMADSMNNEGCGDKALKVFMHLRADPKYGPKSCLYAGQYHVKTSDYESAMQDFEIGLKHSDAPVEIKIELQYNYARACFDKNFIPKGLALLQEIKKKNSNYKDVNTLISRYQELSQNSNLQIYLSSNNSEFVSLCRKIINKKYANSSVKIMNIDVDALYTDILAEIVSQKWEDIALFRFFRTSGSTGEIYIREFHGHMQDSKAARGFCLSAGNFTEEAHKYIEGRPIDLIEKNDLTKVLKQVSV